MLACLQKGIRDETATVSSSLWLISRTFLLWNTGRTHSNNGHVLYIISCLHYFEQIQDGLRTMQGVLTPFHIFKCRGGNSRIDRRRHGESRKLANTAVKIDKYL